nr:phage protease [uncultured Shinella sp.]
MAAIADGPAMSKLLAAILCSQLLPEGNAAPDWILLVPAGEIVARDGREFTNLTPDAVVTAFRDDRKDMPVDYEHATHLRAPEGLSAPAVAWVDDVDVRDGAIWGHVSWNADGRAAVESKAYRYISPVVHPDEKRNVARISSVALTNDPALYLPALLRRDQPEKETDMLKAIALALGLAEAASEAEILSKIGANKTDTELLTRKAEKPDPQLFVARKDHDAVVELCSQQKTEIETLKSADLDRAVTAAVEGAIAGGKVIPAVKDSEIELCRAIGVAKYEERLSRMAAIVKPGEGQAAREAETLKSAALTDAEVAMCRRLGLKEEDFRKTRDDAA